MKLDLNKIAPAAQLIGGEPKPAAPSMTTAERERAMREWTPALGYVLCERAEPGRSRGGLIMTEEEEYRYYALKSSRGYYDHGVLVESDIQPGDRVVPEPQPQVRILAGKSPETVMGTRTLRVNAMPQNWVLLSLRECVLVHRAEAQPE